MGSNYLSSSSRVGSAQHAIGRILALFAVLAMTVGGFTASAFAVQKEQQAEAFDPIKWIACDLFGEDSFPAIVYQITQTSDIQFQLFSKSYAGSGASDVRAGLNAVLDFVRTKGEENTYEKPHALSFSTINTHIIGQDFAGSLPTDVNSRPWDRWNTGPKVNPFDRFGVAGLTFSNYLGEWKHLFINACEADGEGDSAGKAKYDTGASSKLVKVVSWNICGDQSVCSMPDLYGVDNWVCNIPPRGTGNQCGEWHNSVLGVTITRDTVWHPEPPHSPTNSGAQKNKDRWELAWRGASEERPGEIPTLNPEVFLLQESPGPSAEIMCRELEQVPTTTNQRICFDSKKFTLVPNSEAGGSLFPLGLNGSKRFDTTWKGWQTPGSSGAAKCSNEGNGFAWATLQDTAGRRSVWVSMHTRAHEGFDAVRIRQAECVVNFLKNNFKDSFYPIVIGGDMNSGDPVPDSWDFGAATLEERCSSYRVAGRNNAAKSLCAGGFIPGAALATSPRDLFKSSLPGASPWKSHGAGSAGESGGHLDSIWVNNYIGVGEYRIFAPAGIATSDHAAVASTVNLSGLYAAQPGDPQDPGTNKYYDTRLEPRSVWEDVDTSIDPRTAQFSRGLGARMAGAFMTNFTNFIFFFTKLIVVFTVALIGLAFSDVSKMFGITTIVSGADGHGGMFQSLHDNIFTPMIVLAFAATAAHMLWYGIIKRQYRHALGSLLRTLGCFFAAVIIAVSPAWFIALPNNVAIVAQAVIATQMNDNLVGGNGLCTSNLADGTNFEDWGDLSNSTSINTLRHESYGILEKASINMQSSVGCALWYNLLLRPWSEAQFGTTYDHLYGTEEGVCNSTAEDANPVHICLGNETNEKTNRNWRWVGDPLVPMGDGSSEYNWALLQISTQTNAHAPIVAPEKRGVSSAYSQGVANDWWRVVDAVSNYDETLKSISVCDDADPEMASCSGAGGGKVEVDGKEYDVRDTAIPANERDTPPIPTVLPPNTLEQWNDWVGNNQGHRIATVFSSVLIAGLGVIAPLVFSIVSVAYAIGISILMALAPVFFLFGCWAGRGQEIFKAWIDLVINLTMKRIGIGILTIISIIFTATILEKMGEVGYWKSLLLLVIISIALIANRGKILNALAWARFSTIDLTTTGKKIGQIGADVGKIGTGAVVGGLAGASEGGGAKGFKGGAMAGMKRQFDNATRGNQFLTSVSTGAMYAKDQDLSNLTCGLCNKPIHPDETIFKLPTVGFVHGPEENCDNQLADRDEYYAAGAVEVGIADAKIPELAPTQYSSSRAIALQHELVNGVDMNMAKNIAAVAELADLVKKDIESHANASTRNKGRSVKVPHPALPQQIRPYVDQRVLDAAWDNEEYEFVKAAYASGWSDWAIANNVEVEKAEVLAKVQEVDSTSRSDRRNSFND